MVGGIACATLLSDSTLSGIELMVSGGIVWGVELI